MVLDALDRPPKEDDGAGVPGAASVLGQTPDSRPLVRRDGTGMDESEGSARRPAEVYEAPWPVTIVRARYGGIYEPGAWVAFSAWPDQLPAEWNADDVTAMDFYATHLREIGGGRTPNEAYDDLVHKLAARRAEA